MGGGEGGQEGGGMGRGGWQRGGGGVDGNGEGETGRRNLEGRNGEGDMLRGAILTGRGWQLGRGREEEMERGGKWGRGEDGKEAMGRREREIGGMGRERRRGKRRGDFTDGYDGMPG